jgi:hypothetical protein
VSIQSPSFARQRLRWILFAMFATLGLIWLVWGALHPHDREGLVFGPLFLVVGSLGARYMWRDQQKRAK